MIEEVVKFVECRGWTAQQCEVSSEFVNVKWVGMIVVEGSVCVELLVSLL